MKFCSTFLTAPYHSLKLICRKIDFSAAIVAKSQIFQSQKKTSIFNKSVQYIFLGTIERLICHIL